LSEHDPNQICGTCRFGANKRRHFVQCRRYPPTSSGGWKDVPLDAWCGEWAPVTVYTQVDSPSFATPDEASVITSTTDIPALFTGSSIEEELRSGRLVIPGVSFEPLEIDQQILERNYTRADLIRNTADEDPNNQVVNVIEEDGFRTIQFASGRVQREWMDTVDGTSEEPVGPVAVQTDHLGQEIIEAIDYDTLGNALILRCVDGGTLQYFLADRTVVSSLLTGGRTLQEESQLRDVWSRVGQVQERQRVLEILNGMLRGNHGLLRTSLMTDAERAANMDQNRWLASLIVRLGEAEEEGND
jgi:hypothetical protein